MLVSICGGEAKGLGVLSLLGYDAGHTPHHKEFHIDLRIVEENGQEKLLFEVDLAKRWLILKVLDDDYLGSTMTNERYEVNSKSAVR
jgi:hypothetical protein